MNKYAAILILSIMIIGCKTPSVITKTEIKWRDTTVYVKVPVYIDKVINVPLPVHDTLKIRETVYVGNNGMATMNPVHREKGIIGAEISIVNGKLEADLYLTDSTIQYRYIDTLTYEDSIRIYNAIKETTTDTTVVKKEKFIPKIYRFAFWFFIIFTVAVIVFVVYKIKGEAINSAIKKFIK